MFLIMVLFGLSGVRKPLVLLKSKTGGLRNLVYRATSDGMMSGEFRGGVCNEKILYIH